MLTSGDLRHNIEEHVINPASDREIRSLVKSRNKWKKRSNITETLGQLSILVSTILAFASGVYKGEDSLAFAAGCVNAASLSFLRFSSYSFNESNERNVSLNILLNRVNVMPFPNDVNIPQSISLQHMNHHNSVSGLNNSIPNSPIEYV